VTAVYFDLDGTLLTDDTPFPDLFAAALGEGADPPPAAVDAFSETLLSALADLDPAPYERAFRRVCTAHGVDGDPAALAERFRQREVAATRLRDGARSLVETVAARHPTGILTNGHGPTQRQKADAHGLVDLVDTVVVSNEVGARKPASELFEHAARELPADGDADAHVYVGDTYDEDVVGAREAGWQAVYVGENPQHRREAAVAAHDAGALAAVLVPLLA
jgi:putative hydrolase of the HAD superfamily